MSEPAAPTVEVALQHAFPGGFELDVSFSTRSASLAVFGPSGSGKTTVLNALAGLLRPAKGRIALGGRVLFDREAGVDLPPRRRHVGLVVQDGLLFPLLSVRQNLLFGAPREGGRLTLERVAELLEVQHLLDRRPRNLSGGERQRVALGRAVLAEPAALLCDEPFSALDAARRRRLVRILARLVDELDLPLVLVTHNVSEVLALASDVVVLERGRVVAQGPPLSLLERLAEGEGALRNVWEGVVAPPDGVPESEDTATRVQLDGGPLVHAPLPPLPAGRRVRLRVPPNAVALSRHDAADTSARNRLRGQVLELSPREGLLEVSLDVGVPLTAQITPASAHELELTPGAKVTATFKAASTEVLWVEPES